MGPLDHRVARPTISGWTIAGMPRHTASSVTTVKPHAQMGVGVGIAHVEPAVDERVLAQRGAQRRDDVEQHAV